MVGMIRVLLIDDDEDEYIIARDLLADVREIQYRLDWVQTYAEGLETIRREGHDVYLVDYRLGEKDGLQLIQEAVASGFQKPFIVLTGQGSRDVDFRAMRSGAADYLVKDQLSADMLERAIRYSLRANQAALEKRELEKRLAQAQKLESLGTLAGGIAHDFNNILTAILGFSEVAFESTSKGSRLYDDLQEIYSAGKRAKELVHRILTFARRTDEELKPIYVDMIAKEALKLLRSTIPSTIDIRQDIRSRSMIMADPSQIHRIFLNLCTNAAHAMEHTGGVLTVALADVKKEAATSGSLPEMKDGEYVQISVTDTGSGIQPGILPFIFDPYFTTKSQDEGTGMGLAMVHGIVKGYGGEITVESTLGKGTTFSVFLPVARKSAEAVAYETEALPVGSERILFVDDEVPITKVSRYLLESLGYKPTICTDSRVALELFKSKRGDFDLVITDMNMPGMAGDRLAVEILKIRSDMPIVLCTGYNKKISEEGVRELGIRALARKPLVKKDLAVTIRKVLDEIQHKGGG